jgi:cysteine-rich repeat protein
MIFHQPRLPSPAQPFPFPALLTSCSLPISALVLQQNLCRYSFCIADGPLSVPTLCDWVLLLLQAVAEDALQRVIALGAAPMVSLAGCWGSAPAVAISVLQSDACSDAPESALAIDISLQNHYTADAREDDGARNVFVIEGKGRTLLRFAGCGVSSALLGPGGSCAPVGFCGDGIRDGSQEDCDDGNLLARDGCGPDCRVEPFCQCSGGALTMTDTCICSPNRPFSVAALPAGEASAGEGWWWWQRVLTWPSYEVDAFKPSVKELG